MQWPDEATAAAEQSGQQLEKVIGYSDGGEFASRVGPQPLESSGGSGRFADLVQSRIVSTKDKERQHQTQGQEGKAAGMLPLPASHEQLEWQPNLQVVPKPVHGAGQQMRLSSVAIGGDCKLEPCLSNQHQRLLTHTHDEYLMPPQ